MKNVYYTSGVESHKQASFATKEEAEKFVADELKGMNLVEDGTSEYLYSTARIFHYEIYDGEPIQEDELVDPIYTSNYYYAE